MTGPEVDPHQDVVLVPEPGSVRKPLGPLAFDIDANEALATILAELADDKDDRRKAIRWACHQEMEIALPGAQEYHRAMIFDMSAGGMRVKPLESLSKKSLPVGISVHIRLATEAGSFRGRARVVRLAENGQLGVELQSVSTAMKEILAQEMARIQARAAGNMPLARKRKVVKSELVEQIVQRAAPAPTQNQKVNDDLRRGGSLLDALVEGRQRPRDVHSRWVR
ncbi:MAG: PilZ domain-containing protein [Candidatus Sericytochromatia bacterium]|nr:PilZ domain-containing protein [Candidatus Tanganyikabacteria bacterium]